MKYAIVDNKIVNTETHEISDFVIKLGDTLTFTLNPKFLTIAEICALKNKQVIFPDSMSDILKRPANEIKAECQLLVALGYAPKGETVNV